MTDQRSQNLDFVAHSESQEDDNTFVLHNKDSKFLHELLLMHTCDMAPMYSKLMHLLAYNLKFYDMHSQ